MTERIEQVMGAGKGASILVHISTNNADREGTAAIVKKLGGCPFNGPLSGTKYPTRAASPIKYNADQEPVKLKRLEP